MTYWYFKLDKINQICFHMPQFYFLKNSLKEEGFVRDRERKMKKYRQWMHILNSTEYF